VYASAVSHLIAVECLLKHKTPHNFTIGDHFDPFGPLQDTRKKEEKLGRVFADEGDVMEEHERDKVEQNALQVSVENPALLMTSFSIFS